MVLLLLLLCFLIIKLFILFFYMLSVSQLIIEQNTWVPEFILPDYLLFNTKTWNFFITYKENCINEIFAIWHDLATLCSAFMALWMCVRQQWSRKGELRFRPRLHATGQPGVLRCHSRPTSVSSIANIIIKKITFTAFQAVQAARLCIFQYGRTYLQSAAAGF